MGGVKSSLASPPRGMVIDAQVHVSAPHSHAFPWDREAQKRIAPEAHGKFEDAACSAENLIALMDATGVDAAILARRGVLYGGTARSVVRWPELAAEETLAEGSNEYRGRA